MKTLLLPFLLAALPAAAWAEAPAWHIVPGESALAFTASQENSPVSGTFAHFSGDIIFDPAQLAESRIRIAVDAASVTASDADMAATLKAPDWFDAGQFPQAVFTSAHIAKAGANAYTADGTLAWKGKEVPVTLSFTLAEYTAAKALAKGTATLKRSAFGVGRATKTDSVADEVKVTFTLAATRE